MLPAFAGRWLLPRLGRFQAAHPYLSVAMRLSLELADLDADRTLNLAIRYGPGNWYGVDAVRPMSETLFPVAAPHYRNGRLPRRPATALASPAPRWQATTSRPDG